MQKKKIDIHELAILATKTVIGYVVFIVFFYAIPVYKEARLVVANSNSNSSNLNSVTNLATSSYKNAFANRLIIGEETLIVKIVETPDDRAIGLSKTNKLQPNEGMFFIFPEPGLHGIWMRDMKFSIDIIWLDEFKQVIHIAENVSPETYPEAFRPSQNAKYVLEVNAGFVKKAGIKIFDQASLI